MTTLAALLDQRQTRVDRLMGLLRAARDRRADGQAATGRRSNEHSKQEER